VFAGNIIEVWKVVLGGSTRNQIVKKKGAKAPLIVLI